jgi:anti-sigma factor RsiW
MLSEEAHLRLRELLPWQANGTLVAAEAATLRAHLAGCAACRAELAQCAQIAAALPSREDAGWQPSPAHWSRVLTTVDAAPDAAVDETVNPAQGRGAAPQRPKRFEWLRGWFIGSPRPMRWALATQTALIVALGIAFIVPTPQPHFETLSRGERSAAQRAVALRVAFHDNVTEREWRDLLLAIHGQIATGPSALGVYTIALEPNDAASALVQLRQHPKVRLAEPLDAQGPR